MKQRLFKVLFVCMAVAFLPQVAHAAGDVEINATNFPDGNFRSYLLQQDYGIDGKLTEEEIKKITELNVSGKGIHSLQGIEYFTALTELHCNKNQLTALNVSKCTALEVLWCYTNQLTSLDVSKNTALATLYCYDNQLTTLDVSKNTALAKLYCNQNPLKTLDVSRNIALTKLACKDNQLTSLDVSKNTALIDLTCENNQLISLDISKNTTLKNLQCHNNQLTHLDGINCTQLEYLKVYRNKIKGASMDNLISSLPKKKDNAYYPPELYVYSLQSPDEGNVCTKEQVKAAKEKGWTVLGSDGWQYEGSDDTPTNINGIRTEADKDVPVYNLRGQRLTAPQKGVNIIGGRKVVVR